MFKNLKIMTAIYCCLTINIQASLQVAVPISDFCAGNSLILIARDGWGHDQVVGCVSLEDGKTTFSHDELFYNNQKVPMILDQKVTTMSDLYKNQIKNENETFIYLYFDVNCKDIVRVLMIKNNLLADNPYDVLQFSTILIEDDEYEDDFFMDDELSCLNLTDIQGTDPVQLSSYDSVVLGMYALWAIQAEHVKRTYKNVMNWLDVHDAQ